MVCIFTESTFFQNGFSHTFCWSKSIIGTFDADRLIQDFNYISVALNFFHTIHIRLLVPVKKKIVLNVIN